MRVKRILSFVLVAVFILCSVVSVGPSAAVGKKTVQRTIAIVYDNSGSMFMNKNKAWCQAQYAIEVFATMMNEGDKLLVYPMWPVIPESGGDTYTYQNNPIVITEDSQKSLIHTLKSDLTNGDYTPIESIDAAHNGLANESGEKWLVVLTDGKTFYTNQQELSVQNTKAALEEKFTQYNPSESILYLGIGENLLAPQIDTIDSCFYASRTTSSENVPLVLTEMCNMIFGRDELPSDRVGTGTVKFDVPLLKLYAFIQGENIDSVKLSNGAEEIQATQTFTPVYGSAGCDSPYAIVQDFDIDRTLQGYIAVYNNLPGGEYTYSYTGNMSSVKFYYEVDADLQVSLLNEAGNRVSEAGEVTPGDYLLQYALVDKDGNILNSDLLGDVNFNLSYSVNGENFTPSSNTSGTEKLFIGEDTEFVLDFAEVNFLNGYKIRKTGTELGFLSIPFSASKKSAKELSVTLTGGTDSIDGDLVAEIPAYFASLSYDGLDVTGKALESVTFSAEVSCESMDCIVTPVDSGYELKLAAKEGITVVPAGEYVISVKALMTSQTVEDSTASATTSIVINKISDSIHVELRSPTTVYSTIGLKNEPDIIADITYNGEKLTAEQFDSLVFNAEAEGLQLIVTPLSSESAYSIRIDPDSDVKKGAYTISFNASGITDRAGDELTAGNALGIQVQHLPQWVIVLLYILAFLLLALLIFLYMRMPVLPKNIKIANVSVRINGEDIRNIKASVVYPTRGKKRDVKITGTGLLKNAFWRATLIPAKDSYRYLPSKKRKALVVNGSVKSSANVDSLTVGSEKFSKDDNGKLIRVSKREKDFKFPKSRINYTGSKDIDGIASNYSITGDIKFE